MDSRDLRQHILASLARNLGRSVDELQSLMEQDLEHLGLDSHGLMRVILDVEAASGSADLSVPDEALETPTTLVDALLAALQSRP